MQKEESLCTLTNFFAGRKWLQKFLMRHKERISMRSPDQLSYARGKGFTKANVNKFFDMYEAEFAKIKGNPMRLYNVDETGINYSPPPLLREDN